MDALQFVQACLERTRTPVREIAQSAGVGESWLGMFKRGRIPDPGYSKVKLLADYFLRVGELPLLHDDQPPRGDDRPRA